MKIISVALLTGILLTGCVRNAELVKRAEHAVREDVATVVSPAKPPEKGLADLTLRASLKTHQASAFWIGNDPHGTADYQFLVNIDGQPLRLYGSCVTEDTSFQSARNPESGLGTRCRFQSHVRIKSGSHRIVVALPHDNVALDREITLEERSDNLLEVAPSYYVRQSGRGKASATSFKEGISGLELLLNGKYL